MKSLVGSWYSVTPFQFYSYRPLNAINMDENPSFTFYFLSKTNWTDFTYLNPEIDSYLVTQILHIIFMAPKAPI